MTIAERLQEARRLVLGVTAAAAVLILVFGTLALLAQYQLARRLQDVDRAVRDLQAHQLRPARRQRALLLRFQGNPAASGGLRYRLLETTGKADPWAVSEQDQVLAEGALEPKPDVRIGLPIPDDVVAATAAGPDPGTGAGALQLDVLARTNNGVRQHEGAPIRLFLVCEHGLGQPSRWPVPASFFGVAKRRGDDSDEKLTACSRFIAFRGLPRLWLELDGARLAAGFGEAAVFDLWFNFDAVMLAGAAAEGADDGR